jgi:IclR family KDG regulon transcriptional repressor
MDYTVAAVDEALNLLFLVAKEPGLGLTDLSKRSGNTKARAFRLLMTMEQRGLVKRRGDKAAYYLSFKALHLGAAAHNQIDLVHLAQEPLELLGASFNETIALRVRDGLETVCVARWESTQSLRVHGEVGHRRPLYAGASSKLLLAFAPDDVVETVLSLERRRFTSNTLVSKAALGQEIKRVRAQDYAISIGERTADTAAIAVPIRDGSGGVIAALSISTPASRMTDERIKPYLQALQLQAMQISQRLGYEAG